MRRRPEGDGYSHLPIGGNGGGLGGNGSGGGTGLGGSGGDGGFGCVGELSGIGPPVTESILLKPFAVNLVNAHEAADEIYIFLISKRAGFSRPGELTRRFRVIGIISGVALGSISGKRLPFIHQNRMIDGDSRKSAEISNEWLSARQSFIEVCVRLFLVPAAMEENNPAVA